MACVAIVTAQICAVDAARGQVSDSNSINTMDLDPSQVLNALVIAVRMSYLDGR